MPWRLRNEVRRLLTLPWIRVRFLFTGVAWGAGWRVLGMPIIQRHRGSRILIGSRITLRSTPRSNPLAPNHAVVLSTRSRNAVLSIGEGCGFTGTTIVAEERVEIGNRVLFGANVTVADTDFHPLAPESRRIDINAGSHKPIRIEDDVFIGMNALVLKGVTIGEGAVVGAGSVVRSDVPPRAIVAGNPAVVVGKV
jgi:acyl-[acyl carrier protein]--UDP-N-acetylglucosamine O-acyltransferase